MQEMIMKRLLNVATKKGWSFKLSDHTLSSKVLHPRESLTISGRFKNNGFRIGTVYVQILIADPYDHNNVLFDSHRDLDENRKRTLRIVDISTGDQGEFSLSWLIPEDIKPSVYDLKIMLWNPPKLFKERKTGLFDQTPWLGCFEVLNQKKSTNRIRLFISYSWKNEKHQNWVQELYEELIKYGYEVCFDKQYIRPGEEITHYMERMMHSSDFIIMICSDEYTKKSNNRLGGVGYETVIVTNIYLNTKEKWKYIPIIRDNKEKMIPIYLGSALYVDMDCDNWRGQPFQSIIKSIEKAANK